MHILSKLVDFLRYPCLTEQLIEGEHAALHEGHSVGEWIIFKQRMTKGRCSSTALLKDAAKELSVQSGNTNTRKKRQ